MLTYIGLDFDKSEFQDEEEEARTLGRRFAICGFLDTLAIICGVALFFVNQSVKAHAVSQTRSLANPLFLVSHGGAGITALILIASNVPVVVIDVWGYVRSQKDAVR